jgi:Uma2 family endonuclease
VTVAPFIEPELTRRVKRDEYHRMAEVGIFDGERVELLRGAIIKMSPTNPPHADTLDRLAEILLPALVGRARVRTQGPVLAADDSEPEPDLAVFALGDYSGRHPDRVMLVVEVSDSPLRKDRLLKGPLYAESGFEEYWIVDVAARTVEVHRGPLGDGWKSVTRHDATETLHVAAFPDVTLPIAQLFA